jgi:hypothetical protein
MSGFLASALMKRLVRENDRFLGRTLDHVFTS